MRTSKMRREIELKKGWVFTGRDGKAVKVDLPHTWNAVDGKDEMCIRDSLWAGMIIIGILYGAFTGKMPDITNAALDSAKEAVTLCITMVGVMAFWMGIMEIASRAGIIEMASKKMRPLIRFLFPNIPEGHRANQYITTNFIANFLGLGWAATPAGLQGMQALAELEQERRMKRAPGKARKPGVASNEMCTFLIMNISSLQLIPINVIADVYKRQT